MHSPIITSVNQYLNMKSILNCILSNLKNPNNKMIIFTLLGLWAFSMIPANVVGDAMEQLVCIQDFYTAAKLKINSQSSGTWEYVEGGSDEEFVLIQNRKSFQRYIIRPRVLRNVSTRDLSVMILGKVTSFPVGIAPIAIQKVLDPDGECATARGAGIAGSIFILSTMSSTSIEEVAQCAPQTRLWFQLYFQTDRAVNIDLITRAEKAGFEAIVLTVDSQMIGKRRGNLKQPLKLPANARLANFEKGMTESSSNNGSFSKMRDNANPVRDNSITWEVIDWIRRQSTMKLVLKGILTGEDAILAAEAGVDGIIVSNHGGRQLDSVLPTIEVLPEIVGALQGLRSGAVEVYLDGGISLGTDVFKALALGAKMVFVGRGALWGLSVGGEQGVAKVMELYKSELNLTMGLAGISTMSQINSKFVQRYIPL